jgi:ZIP family zinc transporter
VGDLEELHKMAAQIVEYETRENHEWEGQAQSDKSERSDEGEGGEGEGGEEVENNNDETQEDDRVSEDKEDDAEEQKALMRMSINTAVAIGLHNFPEGLATFVAALNDTRVGAVLAVAIAIHNIPEGLCVAMPVYYATGNRWKAFGWAVLSGVSEPIAALLGWAVLANSFSDDMYAILFGLVAGMMVIISVRELLPTAHRYDPEDTVVTYSFMVGMAIMAVSLVLFLI